MHYVQGFDVSCTFLTRERHFAIRPTKWQSDAVLMACEMVSGLDMPLSQVTVRGSDGGFFFAGKDLAWWNSIGFLALSVGPA